jgi:hypothetical protein
MAALSLPAAAEATVVDSTFENLTFANGSLAIDVDGNGTTDFSLYANGVYAYLQVYNNGSLHLFDNTADLTNFAFGEEISTLGGGTMGYFDSFVNGAGYVGVTFEREGLDYAGWLHFDFTGMDTWRDGILTAGAWESVAGESIAAGATAIPEPAHVAAGFGLFAGLAAWLRRRGAKR